MKRKLMIAQIGNVPSRLAIERICRGMDDVSTFREHLTEERKLSSKEALKIVDSGDIEPNRKALEATLDYMKRYLESREKPKRSASLTQMSKNRREASMIKPKIAKLEKALGKK